MMRAISISILSAICLCIFAWFLLPDHMYVEDALGVLLLVFVLSGVVVFVSFARRGKR